MGRSSMAAFLGSRLASGVSRPRGIGFDHDEARRRGLHRAGHIAGGDIEPDKRGRTPRTDPPDDTFHLDLAPDDERPVPLECLLGVDHPAPDKLGCCQKVLGHCEQRHRAEGRRCCRRPALGVVACGRHQVGHPVGSECERGRSDPPTLEAAEWRTVVSDHADPTRSGRGLSACWRSPVPMQTCSLHPQGRLGKLPLVGLPRPWDQRVSRCKVWTRHHLQYFCNPSRSLVLVLFLVVT